MAMNAHEPKQDSGYSDTESGFGTTPGMWEMLSDMLIGELLPEPMNTAIYALRDGKARLVPLESKS
jgi:hypothetical protein